MMRDTAIQTVSQSQTKRESSTGWYGFIRSAIVSGFASYGSAQFGIGMHSEPEVDEPPGKGIAVSATCNQQVATVGPATRGLRIFSGASFRMRRESDERNGKENAAHAHPSDQLSSGAVASTKTRGHAAVLRSKRQSAVLGVA